MIFFLSGSTGAGRAEPTNAHSRARRPRNKLLWQRATEFKRLRQRYQNNLQDMRLAHLGLGRIVAL